MTQRGCCSFRDHYKFELRYRHNRVTWCSHLFQARCQHEWRIISKPGLLVVLQLCLQKVWWVSILSCWVPAYLPVDSTADIDSYGYSHRYDWFQVFHRLTDWILITKTAVEVVFIEFVSFTHPRILGDVSINCFQTLDVPRRQRYDECKVHYIKQASKIGWTSVTTPLVAPGPCKHSVWHGLRCVWCFTAPYFQRGTLLVSVIIVMIYTKSFT